MKVFSVDDVNSWIGRTKSPPDLLTFVDEHLRKTYKNVYAHPLSPNSEKHWPSRELGSVMVLAGFQNRMVVGTIFMDRVVWNVTTGDITMHASSPTFFQDIVKHLDEGAYIGKFVERS